MVDDKDRKKVHKQVKKLQSEAALSDGDAVKIVSKKPTLADITKQAEKAVEAKSKKKASKDKDDGAISINVKVHKKEPAKTEDKADEKPKDEPKKPEPIISGHHQKPVVTVVGTSKAETVEKVAQKPEEKPEPKPADTQVEKMGEHALLETKPKPSDEEGSVESNIKPESHDAPAMTHEKKLTPPSSAGLPKLEQSQTSAPQPPTKLKTPEQIKAENAKRGTPQQQNPKVFDTRAYHLPIKHTHHQRGSIGTLLSIIIILAVIGGAAYFAIQADLINIEF